MPDIRYDRPNRQRQYLSINKHQIHANNNFSKWLNVNIEKQTFDNADYGNFSHTIGNIAWLDDNGNLWGFLHGFQDVGTKKEQFGFFICATNPNAEWHGYPIVPFCSRKYHISSSLLERLVNDGFIDENDIPSIINQKRL